MEKKHVHFSLRSVLSFLLVCLLQRSTQAQQICSAEPLVTIQENNAVGAVVTTVTIEEGVILTLTNNADNAFALIGNDVTATVVLDFETLPGSLTVAIDCRKGEQMLSLAIRVLVENVNDNEPVFSQSQYTLNVNELTPIGTSVGEFAATDADKDSLSYTLEPRTAGFELQGNSPKILVKDVLEYDTVKSVTLTIYAKDVPIPPSHSFTATATILVTIVDIDNRPPYFQPCTPTIVGTSTICLSSGYAGKVNLTEQAVGALPLQPGPVFATDGDTGLNVPITYRIVLGNEAGIFQINDNNGDLTMLKAVDVAGPITLTVLASETTNGNQYATTTVRITVVNKSKNPPKFEKTEYEGFIAADAGIDSMVLEGKSSNRPLKVQARDADFADGINPNIRYELQKSEGFSITPQGFILMTQTLEPGPVSLELHAIDSSNEESSTAILSVEVMPGITTMPPTTEMATTEMATINMTTTEMATTDTTVMATTVMATTVMSTTKMATTEMATTEVATATQTTSTTDRELGSPGGYGSEDMAALGASLAVLLVITIFIIGLLVFRIQKSKTNWRKLSEASIFRSSLGKGPGELKDGVQYTNDGFQNDGEPGGIGSDGTDEKDGKRGIGTEVTPRAVDEIVLKVSAPQYLNLLPDNSSLTGSDKAGSEKEVKPILTKERRMEEGYKSVWFKEDIDPNAKEEVVIIPDNRERDGDHNDDDDDEKLSREEEDEDDNFSGDVDNKRRARFEDSDEDENLTSDL
ncbi:hypothetical protein UPYG_G00262820 [Umbra pygmaea]|uniref:Cadherin domain-containing protein n=1 Tax=Umbra pygmaea TaxID=75934 RepID=A0ABD0WED4_UMBPY